MKKSLHLSHTDIDSDSRILKEMGVLADAGYSVSGIGVCIEEGAKKSDISLNANIVSISLRSRNFTFLPKTIRHIASLFELVVKMLPLAIRQQPDIIHCHDTLALPLSVIVKIFTGARLIYDAHELESDRNGLSNIQGWLTLRVEKLVWKCVDALIVVSPSIDLWYQKYIGSKYSEVIINSPLFSNEDHQDQDYLRRKFNIPSESNIFIYVGILGSGRGIELITKAFQHSSIRSHVVFLGYGEFIDELKCMSYKFANIHVHDAVPHSHVVPIVQSADYGLCLIQNVSLSDYYCLPNKLFEYCFAGVPVLASDFPDIRTVLTKYNIGECCSFEIEDIITSIRALESSPTCLVFNDLTPLSWQAQAIKLLALYEKIG